jgi:hypothetical protein
MRSDNLEIQSNDYSRETGSCKVLWRLPLFLPAWSWTDFSKEWQEDSLKEYGNNTGTRTNGNNDLLCGYMLCPMIYAKPFVHMLSGT